jgi:uncharacterized protein (TIGR02118 family)
VGRIKLMALAWRKPGMSVEAFREHYETRHAPLALSLIPQIKSYVRNYVRHDLDHAIEGFEGAGSSTDFDVVTEITYASRADYEASMRILDDPEVRRLIAEDEERFIDRTATKYFLVESVEDRR